MYKIWTPYLYELTFQIEGKQPVHYVGCRWAYGCHPDELLKSYFSSSQVVNLMMKKYGKDKWKSKTLKTFDIQRIILHCSLKNGIMGLYDGHKIKRIVSEHVLKEESILLTHLRARQSPKYLNRTNGVHDILCHPLTIFSE